MITITTSLTILGATVVVVTGIFGFMIQYFRKDNLWKDPLNKVVTKVVRIDTEIQGSNQRLDELQKTIEDHDERDQRDFDRIEKKLEKLTDLMIDSLTRNKTSDN